jgi:uncharacterized protein YndB with AHSA1/START domain
MPTAASTDRIEKEIVVKAPRARVWRALTDAAEFGRWFGAEMKDAFAPGARAQGRITYPGYEHLTLDITVERMEPEWLFSWRWRPYAIDPKQDYSSEPTTLVEAADGRPRRHAAQGRGVGFRPRPRGAPGGSVPMNSEGWAEQMGNIARYLDER